MKKLTIIGLAVCFAFALAAPATAADVDFSGSYTVDGNYVSHWNLNDESASNAFMKMCFSLKTVFKASDILSVTTEFDALDGVWGEDDDNKENLDFTRAYMTIKAPIGTFFIGRQKAWAFGTSFLDYEGEADRIKYVKKIDNLKIIAIIQKNNEQDGALDDDGEPVNDVSDQDSDTYYLAGIYKMENTTLGLLGAFKNHKVNPNATTHVYVALPYFVSKFGPLAIQGELRYNWGETDYDAGPDLDIKALAYNLEATYNFGPASVMAGYAFVSGDNDGAADNESSSHSYGVGNDWGKLFILTSDKDVLVNLGDYGNLSKDGDCKYGAKIIYGGATFSPLENLELGVVVGTADADEVPTGVEDDYGMEYDFTLNWQIYDNLTYSAVAAFLSSGDFYKKNEKVTISDNDFEDTYALFHQLELAF